MDPADAPSDPADAPGPGVVDLGRDVCLTLDGCEAREWLVTNGIGGFASATIAGSLTRRYHGLLVAALQPPLGRTLLVAKVEETVSVGASTVELGSNRWANGSIAPTGFAALERFRLAGRLPVWTFAIDAALVEKSVWMEYGRNVTLVRYRLARAAGALRLKLRVLVNARDFHATTRAGDWRMAVEPVAGALRVTPTPGAMPIWIAADRGELRAEHTWYRDFALWRERDRGLEAVDDHLLAAGLEVELTAAAPAITLILAGERERPVLDVRASLARFTARGTELIDQARRANGPATALPGWIEQLVLAADDFVVARPLATDPAAVSIIAGYPWFGDWGRDTMIALPGLALITGRPAIAARVLRTFGRFVDAGMLPNYFPDTGQPPEYNTVDAALWFIEAVRRYDESTGDVSLVRDLFDVLVSIVDAYQAGTRYRIGVDPCDGLVSAGERGVQLTWMDAKVGDWVVTPRSGKPIEINALWYNALCALERFARRADETATADRLAGLAQRAAVGFERYWNAARGWCFDVLDGPHGDDPAFRPNQLFAVALPDSPLPLWRRRAIVAACGERLLTSYGLRSLDRADPAYRGHYGGTVSERDGAYHQGTVWGWLIGPWVEALLRTGTPPSVARTYLEPFRHHLRSYGLGTLAEIADGEQPFAPNGCIAQAWTVAQVLAAWRATASADGFSADL